ncbi:hypothetical protein pb186bvf_016499 [Paramecium bursaria]
MQMNQEARVIVQTSNTKLFHLVQNNRNLLFEDNLRLCYLDSARIYFICIKEFCQNIFPSTPWVVLESPKGVSLLFPHIESGLNGIFIPHGPECQNWMNALQQIVQIIPFANAIAIPQFKVTIQTHAKDVDTNPLENNTQAAGYIKAGGEALKEGLTWIGEKVAAGVQAGGQYINSKVDKQEDVKVSDDTKIKYVAAKTTLSQTFDVAGDYLKQLFKPVAEKGAEFKKDLNEKIDKSENKTLKDGREITVATWDALGTALTGLGTALSQVGDQVSTNTKQIVEKKYGQDVKNTFL